MKKYRNIAIWQTAFLGDAILTLPLIQAVAAAYPKAGLHFWVRQGFQDLFQAVPELTSVTGFAKRGDRRGLAGLRRTAADLAAQNCDLLISAHSSLRSGLIAKLSGIPERIGYASPLNRLLYTTTVDRAFESFEEVERLMRLLEPLGLSGPAPTPRLRLPAMAIDKASELFNLSPGDVSIGLHPGSVWPTKRWPVEYFTRLAALCLDAGWRVLIFGGPGEEDLARTVHAQAQDLTRKPPVSDRLLDLSGRLSLTELAACIARLDCYVTNDSGPMHMAWVQNVPLVAMFGPTTRNLGFYPRGAGSTVLETGHDCRPCGLHGGRQCRLGDHRCMREITPELAFAAVRGKVEAGRN